MAVRRKSGKPKRPSCSVQRCNKRIAAAGLCATHLLRKADAAFSRFIRERDGKCRVCFEREGLQCAHVISRRFRNLRWNESNAVALCMKCHVRFTHWPLTWEAWVDDYFGEGTWTALRKEALGPVPDWKEAAIRWATLDTPTEGQDEC